MGFYPKRAPYKLKSLMTPRKRELQRRKTIRELTATVEGYLLELQKTGGYGLESYNKAFAALYQLEGLAIKGRPH